MLKFTPGNVLFIYSFLVYFFFERSCIEVILKEQHWSKCVSLLFSAITHTKPSGIWYIIELNNTFDGKTNDKVEKVMKNVEKIHRLRIKLRTSMGNIHNFPWFCVRKCRRSFFCLKYKKRIQTKVSCLPESSCAV